MHGEKDSAGHCWLWRGKGTQAMGCRQPLEARKGKKLDSFLEPPEGMLLCNTLILAHPLRLQHLEAFLMVAAACVWGIYSLGWRLKENRSFKPDLAFPEPQAGRPAGVSQNSRREGGLALALLVRARGSPDAGCLCTHQMGFDLRPPSSLCFCQRTSYREKRGL